MLAFAEQALSNASSDGMGSTQDDHIQSIIRQGGQLPANISKQLELPPLGVPVWNYFCDLSRARQSNGFGPQPYTYSEIQAYCNLNGITLQPWELDLLKAIDQVALKIMHKQNQAAEAANKPKGKKK